MNMFLKTVLLLGLSFSFVSCDLADRVSSRAREINNFEKAAFALAKENRHLNNQLTKLKFENQSLKSQISFLNMKLEKRGKKSAGRTLASAPPVQNDLVKFSVYKWQPQQMVTMAEKAYKEKDFEKSSQFFNALIVNYPKSNKVDDQILFQAGISAYESGKHYDWTLKHLNKLLEEYPESKFFRGAKLWVGLTHLKLGDKAAFFRTVEEFRKKYRNTKEWDILSVRYESLIQKYK
ncbi:MAG: tetratricopeptide repeat protein [Bacteriovoracaceae bacterium]